MAFASSFVSLLVHVADNWKRQKLWTAITFNIKAGFQVEFFTHSYWCISMNVRHLVYLLLSRKKTQGRFLSCHHCPFTVVWKREVCRFFPHDVCLTKALMCYLLIQDATNMQRDFVLLCRQLQNIRLLEAWISTWKIEAELLLFFFYKMLPCYFIPCVVCETSPSRQVTLNS